MKLGKIVHLLVAGILLFSTIGVVVNKHYSGGELFSTALFIEAESCCESSSCCASHTDSCTEEADYYRLVADYVITENSDNIFPSDLDFTYIALDIGNHYNLLRFNEKIENLALRIIEPPPNIIDIPVSFQSLLI